MTQIEIIANIISLAGCIVMVCFGFMKNRKQILTMQCVQCGLMGISNLMLGGITGLVVNAVTTLRNLLSMKVKFTLAWKLAFILLQAIIAILTNNLGLIGWLPITAGWLFTWFVDEEDPVVLKLVIMSAQLMWLVYDLVIRNYVGAVFDLLTMLTNGGSAVMTIRARRRHG